jgi:hypothetical protein
MPFIGFFLTGFTGLENYYWVEEINTLDGLSVDHIYHPFTRLWEMLSNVHILQNGGF